MTLVVNNLHPEVEQGLHALVHLTLLSHMQLHEQGVLADNPLHFCRQRLHHGQWAKASDTTLLQGPLKLQRLVGPQPFQKERVGPTAAFNAHQELHDKVAILGKMYEMQP